MLYQNFRNYSSFLLKIALTTATCLSAELLVGWHLEQVSAQTSPSDLTRPVERSPQILPSPQLPQQLPPPDQLLKPSQPAPLPEIVPNVPGEITVERFEVLGSTVFSPEELEKVTKEYTKRPISFAELLQARTAVTQLYISKGYITSGAFIPPQKLTGGVVQIQVLEGGLEDIKVTGTQRLNPEYVRSRLAIATGKPLNRDRLLEALQLLQLNPLLANLSAELSAGAQPGVNLLEIKVAEAKSFNTQILLDNRRSPSVGTFRRQIEVNEGNLFGQGDAIAASYTNTDGSNEYNLNYTFPINPYNGTISFAYNNSNSRVLEEPFNALDIIAASRSYDVTFRQPLSQTPTQEFALGLSASRRESDTALLALPFRLSAGADQNGRTRVSVLRFFQEFTQRSSQQVLALRSQFNFGIAPFALTANDNPYDSFFLSWRGQGQYVNLLAPDTLLLLRADVQLADRSLVPIEQFGLGGQESVRGYRQDFLLGDNGVATTAELRLPILRTPEVQGLLQVTPFLDLGTVWNSSGKPNSSPNTLFGIGVGLRYQQGDRFTARIDYGIPVISVGSTKRTAQESGIYFSIIYNPF